ncbi:MAG: exosortase family protein XrtF [Leeuwenhoekiella sp.]
MAVVKAKSLIILWRKYKSVILFLLTFLGTYFLLSAAYAAYLNYGASQEYYPDVISHYVARQTAWFIDVFGYEGTTRPNQNHPSMLLLVNGVPASRVIEGCNAIAVMIMFLSFVVAFFNGWKRTIWFVLFGLVTIHILNIIRIALFSIGVYKIPQHKDFFHDVAFPLVIYGYVFLLWIYWVKDFKPKKP